MQESSVNQLVQLIRIVKMASTVGTYTPTTAEASQSEEDSASNFEKVLTVLDLVA
ncbi:hypothetical protein ACHAWU_000709 [Discostella pseudostelligera]|uniref:Uncharacterized protein n=1 Tax=Discostella pseudostelligera TaxID=259834 RepID=A0ABD3M5S9_9STRA